MMVWVVTEYSDPYGDESRVHSVWSTKEQADATAAGLVSKWWGSETFEAGSVSAHLLDSLVQRVTEG